MLEEELAEGVIVWTVHDGAPGARAFSVGVNKERADVIVEDAPAGGAFGRVVTDAVAPGEGRVFEDDVLLKFIEERRPDGHLTELVFTWGAGEGIFAQHPEFLSVFGEDEFDKLFGEVRMGSAVQHGDGVGVDDGSGVGEDKRQAVRSGDGDGVPGVDVNDGAGGDIAEHHVFWHGAGALREAAGVAGHGGDDLHAAVEAVDLEDDFVHHVDGARFAEIGGTDPREEARVSEIAPRGGAGKVEARDNDIIVKDAEAGEGSAVPEAARVVERDAEEVRGDVGEDGLRDHDGIEEAFFSETDVRINPAAEEDVNVNAVGAFLEFGIKEFDDIRGAADVKPINLDGRQVTCGTPFVEGALEFDADTFPVRGDDDEISADGVACAEVNDAPGDSGDSGGDQAEVKSVVKAGREHGGGRS